MDEERDVAPIRKAQAGAILELAAATKCSPASSAAAKALADIVLREAAEDLCDAPSEFETAAMTFNRQMDAVLDAGKESARFAMRVTRRTHMARALERAGLVLVDVGQLAKLIEVRADRIAEVAAVVCAAETEAAGGEHHVAELGREFLDDGERELVDRFAGGDFIGDVGRDPMPNYGVND